MDEKDAVSVAVTGVGVEVERWEVAVLTGGPADGVRLRVTGRPGVLQVSRPCRVESAPDGLQVAALHIYRRDLKVKSEPLRYGFDGVSP
ncbi:hypothetical protein ACFU90_19505 [Streptomyces noursei]|uniref:Uncharacterized protein n=2 Tax=Streptomyces TaxID=1883 RepID=A0A059W8T2_STRNR|nr:hypothetical protein [Streptomyces noursei]AKA07648.1 hypothetical protein SAZ_38670 [Streptomyces noursei ZPM]AIA07909.1 hypothetical protein DC74_7489 [Streptomyces noursei]EOS98070.1 hypothetical protein K530_40808 [Streptomyces noursei CCRC 11814]MCZ0975682.1 hypothetical protein [Streptomyces noursei]UWS76239.1 hypothetical protein N1H47_36340 [Streptomyces noursei]